jgi:teichoic acid transport system permease protein
MGDSIAPPDNTGQPSNLMATVDPSTDGSRLRPVDVTVSLRGYLEAVWRRRDFAFAMPAETLRSQHQTTFLGNVWHLGNPLMTVGIYLIVFGGLLGVSRDIENYLLWLTVGVFAYGLTSSTVLGGARAISSNVGLVRAIRFPRALLPISAMISELLTFGFELLAIAGVAVLTGQGLSRRLVFLPAVLLVHTMLNLGGAFIAARLNDAVRDTQQLIPFLFRLMRYLSGVMYPIDKYLDSGHSWLHSMVVWNPIVALLDMYRWVFLGTSVDPGAVIRTVVVSVLVLVFGFRFFVAAEHRYGRP